MTMNNYERERSRSGHHDHDITININNEDVLNALERMEAAAVARHRTVLRRIQAIAVLIDVGGMTSAEEGAALALVQELKAEIAEAADKHT